MEQYWCSLWCLSGRSGTKKMVLMGGFQCPNPICLEIVPLTIHGIRIKLQAYLIDALQIVAELTDFSRHFCVVCDVGFGNYLRIKIVRILTFCQCVNFANAGYFLFCKLQVVDEIPQSKKEVSQSTCGTFLNLAGYFFKSV